MSDAGLSEQRLAEIAARDRARTKGEWRAVEKGNTVKSHAIEGICSGISPKTGNAAFIASCSVDVPDLLAEVKRLRQRERELAVMLAWAEDAIANRDVYRFFAVDHEECLQMCRMATDEGQRIIEEAQHG